MSWSKRKTPISSITTAASDKAFKVASHRRERAATRTALAHDDEAPHRLAYGDPWNSAKDGKAWHGFGWPCVMRM